MWWILCLFPLAAAPILLCAIGKEIWDKLIFVCLFCSLFFIGFFGFTLEMDGYFDRYNGTNQGVVYGRVIEIREYADGTIGLVLDRISIEGEEEKGKLVAYMPASLGEEIRLTDKVSLVGRVGRQNVFYEDFFQAKRVKRDIRFSMQAEKIEVVGKSFNLFLLCRQRAEYAISAGMNGETAAVAKALLFGSTYAIDEGLYENIRMGGIAHIFAVSGLHMGALFGFCLLLFRKTGLSRISKWMRFCLIAGICLFYAGICGFTSSVVRALVMCLIVYASKLIGVKSDLLENVGVAAMLILLLSPSSFFEVGFQLSFGACVGIGVLSKRIGQVFDEIGVRFKTRVLKIDVNEDKPRGLGEQVYLAVSSFLAVSFSAQIFTAPLLLYYFGYISGAGILLNCLFIPLVSAVFGGLLCLITVACLLPIVCAKVLLFLPSAVLSGLLLLFDFVNFSKFAVKGILFSVYAFVPYFLACSFASDKWNLKSKAKICLFFASIGYTGLVNILFSLAF
ncbi:MAG: ComEC/Rec2 family competence protein [Clostridia bacterium]|nr:ComEC/Rec2 family competence protein [Clostridia bacterium]